MSHNPLIPTPEESLLLIVASRTASRVEPVTDRRKKEYTALVRYCSDWERFTQLAGRQKLGAFGHRFVEDYGLKDVVPSEARSVMREGYGFSQAMHLKKSLELLDVLQKLGMEGIIPVVLKGIPLAKLLYADPAVRVSRDIDILCREDELDRVERVLVGNGYTLYEGKLARAECRKYHYHFVYTKGEHMDSVVEVHWNIRRDMKGPRIDMTPLFDVALTVEIDGRPVNTLSPPHALWQLGVNLSYSAFLDLRDLGDVRRLALSLNENQWATLADFSFKSHTYNEVSTALAASEAAFGKFIPEGFRKKLRPSFGIRSALLPTYTPRGFVWRWAPFRSTHTLAVNYFMREGWARKIGYLWRILFPDRASLIETRAAKTIPKQLAKRLRFYWDGFWILKKVVWLILLMPFVTRFGSLSQRWLDPEDHVTLK